MRNIQSNSRKLLALTVALVIGASQQLLAQSGSWTNDASGNWGGSANWQNAVVADGAGNTAFFSNSISASRSITNDTSRTIGNLEFGRPDVFVNSGARGWTVYPTGANVLTLDNGASVPTITCWKGAASAGTSHRFSTPLSSSLGLIKRGESPLWLNAANPNLNGTLIIAAGSVYVQAAGALGSMAVVISNGCYLDFYATSTLNQDVTLNGMGAAQDGNSRSSLQADSVTSGTAGSFTINGTVTLYATSDIGGSSPDQTMTLNGLVSGPGGLVKNGFSNGGGTLVLAHTNNLYAGGTTVSRGTVKATVAGSLGSSDVNVASGATLELGSPAAMNSSASLFLSGTAPLVNLNFTGTQTVASLSFDGGTNLEAVGTWGATGSGASFTDSRFTGPGLLNVTETTPPTPTIYCTWIMVWNGSTESWWRPDKYHGAYIYVNGKWQSIDWVSDSQIVEFVDNCKAAGIEAIIADFTNGWGWLNNRGKRILELCAQRGMKFCIADSSSTSTIESHAQDIWNLFAGPFASNSSAYLTYHGKPVIVAYTTRTGFNAVNSTTGQWRTKFNLVWSSGDDSDSDKWGWQLEPFVGTVPSSDSMFVTSAIKWASGVPDKWRKSLAWLDYNFQLAKNNHPAFCIVGSYDDIGERNSWLVADTTGSLPGEQMRNPAGAVSLTAYYDRVRQWISGTPSVVPGGFLQDGAYRVINRNSNKGLKFPNTDVNSKLIQGTVNTSLTNAFWFTHLGGNDYKITQLSSGLSMEVPGGSSQSGVQIQQTWNNTNAWQTWHLKSAGSGWYEIENSDTAQSLEVSGASTSEGAAVVQGVSNGGLNQQWRFETKLVLNSTNDLTVPSAPVNLKATTRDWQSIELSWAVTPGVDSYIVKRATSSGGPFTNLATGFMSSIYTDRDVVFGADYYYRVSAVNRAGESADSAEFHWTTATGTTVIKDNNANWLNAGSSWIGGAVPGAFDVAVFTNGLFGFVTNMTLGEDITWSGLRVNSPGGTLQIAGGNTLTLGPDGLNLLGNNLTMTNEVVIGTDQTWNLGNKVMYLRGLLSGSNVTLNISGGLGSGLNIDYPGKAPAYHGTINYGAAGTLILSGSFAGTGVVLNVSSPTAIAAVGTVGTTVLGDLMSANSAATLGGGSQNGSVTYRVGDAGNDLTYAGKVSNGSGSATTALAKYGNGTWNLTGANSTFSGGTTVAMGKLLVNNTAGSATGSGTVQVLSGAALGGTGIIAGPLSVAAGGSLSPGPGGVGTGTLTVNNTVTLSGVTLMNLNRTNAQNSARLNASTLTCGGTLNISNAGPAIQAGDTFNLFSASTRSGSFSSIALPALASSLVWNTNSFYTDGTLSAVAVPPPQFNTLVFAGSNLVINGSGGTPGATYYVLSSTNAALPLASWARLVTNAFDAGGNFTITNSMNAPQRFYRLQLP